jgi:hypothetical protein
MKYYGQSKQVCEEIIKRFESGDIPAAMAQVFVKRSDDIPSNKWSWNNQFIQAIFGTSDSRGFQQWKTVGRSVNKGAKAIHILGPCLVSTKDKNEDGSSHKVLIGFKSIPVFRIEDTNITDQKVWDKENQKNIAEENRLSSLPFRDVAESWGLSVQSYNGQGAGYLGYYKYGLSIAVGTENLSTWAHELVHAADDKNGKLTKAHGQKQDNEVVAELGGAALLKMVGQEYEADLGGCWEYIKGYCGNDADKTIKYCFKMINRIAESLNLIFETAKNVPVEISIAA